MKKYCISVQGVNYKLELMPSDVVGYYAYALNPIVGGSHAKTIYIAPDRAEHWIDGKPMAGGLKLASEEVFYLGWIA
jgi:hypothetical protein